MTMLTKAAFFVAKAESSEALGSALLALVPPTRREEGCLRYDIYQSTEDARHWFVYEDWRAEGDFEAHMRTDYVRDFMARVPELCEDVEICEYARRSPPQGSPAQEGGRR